MCKPRWWFECYFCRSSQLDSLLVTVSGFIGLFLDCEQPLFSFRFSKGNTRARERWAAKPRETRAAAREEKREALQVVSLLSCLFRLAPTVTRVVICVSQAFCSTDQEKRETARSLDDFGHLVISTFTFCKFLDLPGTIPVSFSVMMRWKCLAMKRSSQPGSTTPGKRAKKTCRSRSRREAKRVTPNLGRVCEICPEMHALSKTAEMAINRQNRQTVNKNSNEMAKGPFGKWRIWRKWCIWRKWRKWRLIAKIP